MVDPTKESDQLRLWLDWCERHHREPLIQVRRPHVELSARDLEARGLSPATIALKLLVLTRFFRYCVEEQLLEHSPAVHVRHPKISQASTQRDDDGPPRCDQAGRVRPGWWPGSSSQSGHHP
jgi:site-specific recombinase XerD